MTEFKRLIKDILEHTANLGYNEDTNEHDIEVYSYNDIRFMSFEELRDIYMSHISWGLEEFNNYWNDL